MLKTLRSRLLLSYVIVILVTLAIVGLAMLAIVSQPEIRYFSTLQRLDAISRTSRNELVRLSRAGVGNQRIIEVLDETAVQNNVRILVLQASNLSVIYDSDADDAWLGDIISGQEIPRRLLPSTDTNTVAAQFQHANGSNWLLYSRSLSNTSFGRQLVVYAVPEPTTLSFFEDLGFGRALFRAGLIALVVAFLLGLWIARSVARPLQKMAGAAEAISEGNYEQQLPLQGPEEVQRVASSFNVMSTEVSRTRNAHRDFVTNVSHDLKTPITSIRGWSQALLDGTAVTTQDQQHAASIIHSESERMERMVEELLDLARIESGQIQLKKERLDLGQMLRTVHQNFLPRAQEHNIHLTTDLQPVPPISGDHDRLMQVFTNLADNALTHTPPHGRVHIELKSYGSKAIEAIIKDTGKGIEPEELSRIFERFYQVEKSRARANGRASSGLGLAIVYELVNLHQGRIMAQSEVGQGSQFIVRLPVSGAQEGTTRINRQQKIK